MATESYRDKLLSELTQLCSKLNHPPRQEEIDRYSDYEVSAFVSVFGSLEAARQAADIDPPGVPIPTSQVDEHVDTTASVPSHDALLNDLYLILGSVGRSPTADEISDYGVFKPADFVVQFGSLQAATERVEEAVAGEVYAVEDLAAHLEEIGDATGHAPMAADVLRFGFVPLRKYGAYFNSWADALEQAGFDATAQVPVTSSALLEEYTALWDCLGRPPLPDDVTDHIPHSKLAYIRQFGNWGGLLQATDRDSDMPRATFDSRRRLRLGLELRRISELTDSVPAIKATHRHSRYPIEAYQREFRSWTEALEAAGFSPTDEFQQTHTSTDQARTALQELAAAQSAPLTFGMIIESDRINPQALFDSFGSWSMMMNVAGLASSQSSSRDWFQFPATASELVFEDRLRVDEQLETDEVRLADLSRVADECGNVPRPLDVEVRGAFSLATYLEEFGSWSTVVDSVGWSIDDMDCLLQTNRGMILGSLLDSLEREAIRTAAVPTAEAIDTWTDHTSTSYISAFGTFETALKRAGIRLSEPKEYARDVLAAHLYRIGTEFSCRPPKHVLSRVLPHNVGVYKEAFGPMLSAWRAAKNVGQERIPTKSGPSDIETYRRELLEEVPGQSELSGGLTPYDVAAQSSFSPTTYRSFFGSWDAVIDAVGYGERPETRIDDRQDQAVNSAETPNQTRAEVIADLWRVAGQSESPTQISQAQYEQHGDVPLEEVILQFGEFHTAASMAGLETSIKPRVRLTWHAPLNLDLVEELQRVANLINGRPTVDEMNTLGRVAVGTYIRRFGSWGAALDAVFAPDTPAAIPGIVQSADSQHERSRAELLDAIRSLANELGKVPTSTDMNEQGRVSYNVIHDRFGSWDGALRAAGLQPSIATIDLPQPVIDLVDEIDGFGESAAQSLEDAGYEIVGDLYSATEAELLGVNGIGPTTAEKLLSYANSWPFCR